MTGETSASPMFWLPRLMSPFVSPWPVVSRLSPMPLWKWIVHLKWGRGGGFDSCLGKKNCLYNTAEAYLYRLIGEVWGHPPVLPQWHFLTWHFVTFHVKYCWYSCRGIKRMAKRDTGINVPCSPSSIFHPHSLCLLSLFIPPSSYHGTGLHARVSKCGWLAVPGIRRCFNPSGLPKILSPASDTDYSDIF